MLTGTAARPFFVQQETSFPAAQKRSARMRLVRIRKCKLTLARTSAQRAAMRLFDLWQETSFPAAHLKMQAGE